MKNKHIDVAWEREMEGWYAKWMPIIRNFALRSAQMCDVSDRSDVCMKYTQRREQCEENIMQVSICGTDWKEGHKCLPASVLRRFPGAVSVERNCEDGLVEGDEETCASDDKTVPIVRETDALRHARSGELLVSRVESITTQVASTLRHLCLIR